MPKPPTQTLSATTAQCPILDFVHISSRLRPFSLPFLGQFPTESTDQEGTDNYYFHMTRRKKRSKTRFHGLLHFFALGLRFREGWFRVGLIFV